VAFGATTVQHIGIGLVSVGLLLAVGNVAATLRRARPRDATWAGFALAVSFLASTLLLGAVLLHNLHTGFIAQARLRVLGAHLHVAIVGWALVTIVGVSHRLLPMFLLARGANTRWTARALGLLTGGVALLAAGLIAAFPPVAWTGLVLLEAGVGCFLWQAWCFYRVRARRQLDVGMHFARAALAFLLAAALLGPAVLAFGVTHPRLAVVYVTLGLLGGIVLYVVGFFYKIVPLLAWTVRFRGRMGTGPVPKVAELYSAPVAQLQLVLMVAGVALLAAAVAMDAPVAARGAASLYLAGVLLFAGQMVRVVWDGRAGARR
jgi:hypothetical protein